MTALRDRMIERSRLAIAARYKACGNPSVCPVSLCGCRNDAAAVIDALGLEDVGEAMEPFAVAAKRQTHRLDEEGCLVRVAVVRALAAARAKMTGGDGDE